MEQHGRRPERLILYAAAAVIGALAVAMPLHSDDRSVFRFVQRRDYGDLWVSPFFDYFYRPLISTFAKVALDWFGNARWPMRVLQAVLIVACVHTLISFLSSRVSRAASYAAGLLLIASPITFIPITLFAVGVGDVMVGLALLLAIAICWDAQQLDARRCVALLLLGIVAMSSKESGLLVTCYGAMECIRRRQWGYAATFLPLTLGYLALRAAVTPDTHFHFETGFLSRMYSGAELRQQVGVRKYVTYLYNSLANLSLALIGFPRRGVLSIKEALSLRALVSAVTSAAVLYSFRHGTARKDPARFITIGLLVLLNACMGYSYVRPRVMFTAYIGISVLFAFSVDDLRSLKGRWLGLTSTGWVWFLTVAWTTQYVYAVTRLINQVLWATNP